MFMDRDTDHKKHIIFNFSNVSIKKVERTGKDTDATASDNQ